MPESKKLTKRQLAVLDDLFAADSDEQAVLKRHAVPRPLYEKWLADEQFSSQIEQRIANAYCQSRVILARSAADAAKRLVELTRKGEGETARKACLDIISQQHLADCKAPSSAPPTPEDSVPAMNLSPETASRLLAALAQADV
jgi:hypothetical protein